jgi:hypothetical protein
MGGTGTGYGYGSTSRSQVQHGRSGSKFEMSKLRSGRGRLASALRSRSGQEDDGTLTPLEHTITSEQLTGRPGNTTVVQWTGPVDDDIRGQIGRARAGSINSDESQKFMIRKDMQYDVRHEPRA